LSRIPGTPWPEVGGASENLFPAGLRSPDPARNGTTHAQIGPLTDRNELKTGNWPSCASGLELRLALYFLGHSVTIVEALFLESLGQAIRSAGFSIPGSLGVQEGGYMVLDTVLGLSPETGLALSLAKRVRTGEGHERTLVSGRQ
jgi:hypothetical protein